MIQFLIRYQIQPKDISRIRGAVREFVSFLDAEPQLDASYLSPNPKTALNSPIWHAFKTNRI